MFTGSVDGGQVMINDPLALNGGSVTTSGAQMYNDTVMLGADAALSGGLVMFADTLDSDISGPKSLTLATGTVDVEFQSAIGMNQALGAIMIEDARNVTAMFTVQAASLMQMAGTGTTTLMADVTTTAADGVNLTTSGMIELQNIAISTGIGPAHLNGDTMLVGDVQITTTNASISFGESLDGEMGTQRKLELVAGSADVDFNGMVGHDQPLGTLMVMSASDVTADDEFSATTVGLQTITDAATFHGVTTIGTFMVMDAANIMATDAFTAGTADLQKVAGEAAFHGNTTIGTLSTTPNVENVVLFGAMTMITSNTNFQNTGMLMLGNADADEIMFDGGLTTTGGPMMTELHGNVRTSGDVVDLGEMMLMGDSTVDTTAKATSPSGADIMFRQALNANTMSAEGLTLDAGMMGNISFMEPVGEDAAPGLLMIKMANDVTAMETIKVGSLIQEDGMGTTELRDDVTTTEKIDLETNEFQLHGTQADELMLDGGLTVRLNSDVGWHTQVNGENRQLRNVVIVTDSGSIRPEILNVASDGGFAALDQSKNLTLGILGGEGMGRIQTEVVGAGAGLEITIDWREGRPPNVAPADPIPTPDLDGTPNIDAQRVVATLPGTSPQFLEFEHLYNDPRVPVLPGNLIPVFVSISGFAGGNIRLETGAQHVNILDVTPATSGQVFAERVLNGDPNGIQVTILVPVITVPGAASSLPQPEPLPTPVVLPTVLTTVESPTPEPVEAATFETQASAGTAPKSTERYYELRIITFDEDGRPQENPELEIPLKLSADSPLAESADSPLAEEVLPFDPSKLRELFRRLPDDRYRLYLIEDRVDRLMLDFVIEQGRPVEMEVLVVEPEDSAGAAHQNQQPANQPPAAVPAGDGPDEGPLLLPQTNSSMPEQPAFAARLAEASLFSHGGILLAAAGWRRTKNHRPKRAAHELSADQLMARLGRHQGPLMSGCGVRNLSGARPQPVHSPS